MRLICLPYAGGGTASYHRWRPMMPPEVDLLPLALPGHDGRLNEPLYTDLKILADSLAARSSAGTRSIGRLCSWGTAWVRCWRSRSPVRCDGMDSRMPQLLVLTGCPPPHAIVIKEPLHTLPDDELMNALQQRYGGIPTVVAR